jgi:hypothetical protein
MSYAIVINLDYDDYPEEVCAELWDIIEARMLAAGFQRDGRTFFSTLPGDEARALAQRTIEDIEDHLDFHRKHIYRYFKEFYGYDKECVINLMLPPPESIRVDEPDRGQ